MAYFHIHILSSAKLLLYSSQDKTAFLLFSSIQECTSLPHLRVNILPGGIATRATVELEVQVLLQILVQRHDQVPFHECIVASTHIATCEWHALHTGKTLIFTIHQTAKLKFSPNFTAIQSNTVPVSPSYNFHGLQYRRAPYCHGVTGNEATVQYLGCVVLGSRDDRGHVSGGQEVCDCAPVLLHCVQAQPTLGRKSCDYHVSSCDGN